MKNGAKKLPTWTAICLKAAYGTSISERLTKCWRARYVVTKNCSVFGLYVYVHEFGESLVFLPCLDEVSFTELIQEDREKHEKGEHLVCSCDEALEDFRAARPSGTNSAARDSVYSGE